MESDTLKPEEFVGPEAKDGLIPSTAKDKVLIEAKHQRIIEGACRIFYEKGYHQTTIREVAVASGMSMGQLYHYISSKDDVLFLIFKHMNRIWRAHLLESGIEGMEDPFERLKKALRHTLKFVVENKSLFLFVYTETRYLNKRHLKVVLEMENRDIIDFWRRLLSAVNPERPIDGDVDLLTNMISYLMVFFPMRGWNLKERPIEDYMDGLVRFILNGLGVCPKDGNELY